MCSPSAERCPRNVQVMDAAAPYRAHTDDATRLELMRQGICVVDSYVDAARLAMAVCASASTFVSLPPPPPTPPSLTTYLPVVTCEQAGLLTPEAAEHVATAAGADLAKCICTVLDAQAQRDDERAHHGTLRRFWRSIVRVIVSAQMPRHLHLFVSGRTCVRVCSAHSCCAS